MCEKEQICALDETRCPTDPGCEWDTTAKTCTPKSCTHENQQGCVADPDDCRWDAIEQKCEEQPCSYDNADECTLDGDCEWIKPLIECQPKKCNYVTRDTCLNTIPGQCEWQGAQGPCVTAPCKEYSDEMTCNGDVECAWGTDCEVVYCARYNSTSPCDADGKCMWSAADTRCVDKVCDAFNDDQCRCQRDPDCFWGEKSCKTAKFGECPTLDVVVAVDGSASMRSSFGTHPHGFYGMMEMVKDWTKTLSLSGEAAGTTSSATAAGKTRVGIVQFSGKPAILIPATNIVDGAQKAPTGTGTGGRLSGDIAEIVGDLDWQETNYMQGGTYIRAALDVAADMFLASPAGRTKVLLVITDGQVQDADNLSPARGRLEMVGVKTFGVVLRRFDTHTKDDLDAEVTLKTLVSIPQVEHYYNVMISDLPDVLGGLCDPNSMWGKFIAVTETQQAGVHRPCGNYVHKENCVADPGCVYEAVLTACVDTPCMKHCEQASCDADTANTCEWNAADEACYKGEVCPHGSEALCTGDYECMWTQSGECVERGCSHPDENSCLAETDYDCVWKAAEQECVLRPCQYDAENECVADGACEWSGICGDPKMCVEKLCQYTDEATCGGVSLCEWKGSACATKPCVQHPNEKCCNTNEDCYWNVDAAPAVCSEEPCRLFETDATCDAERSCMWDGAAAKCVEKECEKLDGQCACNADPDCYWLVPEASSSGGAARCAFQRYGKCPTLDVMLLIDGGASMSRKFGRHPHGFFALTEMVRDWAISLPLTNEAAGTPPAAGTRAVRVAIAQFAGSEVWGSGDERQILTASGSGTSGGKFTGSKPELLADIDAHEDNFMGASATLQPVPQTTYLLGGLNKAVNLFRTSPVDGRRRVLIAIADGELVDKDSLKTPLAELAQAQVEVFGLVIRPASTHTVVDTTAEESVLAVVGEPKTEHLRNLVIDDVPAVLAALCDPNDEWGKFVAANDEREPCTLMTDKDTCNRDASCVWYDSTLSCGDSPCLKHCEQAVCEKDADINLCVWSNGLCEKEEVCAHAAAPECDADDKCEWNATASVCIGMTCKHDNEQGCLADANNCAWDNLGQVCHVRPCDYDNADECDLDNDCEWNVDSVICEPKKCLYTEEEPCEETIPGLCEWKKVLDDYECVVKPCRGYSDEKSCHGDFKCEWTTAVAPGQCEEKYCRRYCDDASCDERDCTADPECVYNEDELCVEKVCSELADACECRKDTECFWMVATGTSGAEASCVDARYGTCPQLDVVVVFDGSASMRQIMGRHPHGFFAMVEMLKTWVSALPLTGTKAGEPSAAGNLMRVAFIQFSGAPTAPVTGTVAGSAIKTPSGVGTSGRLSGDVAELKADLSWHEDNYMEKGTYVALGLEMAASTLAAAPADGRKKVVYIITDGELQDADVLAPSRAKVASAGGEVFGIVVRRFATRTQVDELAEESLKRIVSAVQENHFVNVDMDELASADGPLTHLCDPTSELGSSLAMGSGGGVHQPCLKYMVKATCNVDAGCVWSEAQLSCVNSPCVAHCDEAACDADVDNGCTGGWNAAASTCYRNPKCAYPTQGECEKYTECAWADAACVEAPCSHITEDGCLADTEYICEWKDPATCRVKPCARHTAQGECEQDTKDLCQWTAADVCVQQPCAYSNATDCTGDAYCEWLDTQTCVVRQCVEYVDDRACDADARCHWDIAAPPGSCQLTRCARYETNVDCGLDTGCVWDDAITNTATGQTGVCVEKTCGDVAERCKCVLDPNCFWSTSAARCEEQVFGKCPTLDAVLLLDGSGSMSLSFGRHPHGFFAMMEMVRDWLKTLPLSKEPASTGANSQVTGQARVGMVQFSGVSSSVGATGGVVGSAKRAPPLIGTGGRLSGDQAELMADVAWHEDNYMGQMTFVEEGLGMAADMFSNDSPTDGRRKVVILVTDGVLMDADRLDTVRARLDQMQVIVFGVGLRRFSARTGDDDKAEAVLKPVVTEPGESHFLSLTIDEVATEVLSGLCDPSTAWGKLVTETGTGSGGTSGSVPCPQYKVKTECNADSSCAWGATTSSCSVTACAAHCDQAVCVADTPNHCDWESAANGCVKKMPCSYTKQAACVRDTECQWKEDVCVEKVCNHADEEPCVEDPVGCVYDSATQVCYEEPCQTKTEELMCLDLSGQCEWDVDHSLCKPDRCSVCTGNQTCCEDPIRSLWCEFESTSACVKRPCVEYIDEMACVEVPDDKCYWDSATSPAMCREAFCPSFDDEDACNQEAECHYDFGVCMNSHCSDVHDTCACTSDTECFWHNGVCVGIHYGACPTMDIVVLIEGSAAMSSVFGRHPHGFQALLEMMRAWASLLPLTGDIGKAGQSGLGYADGLTRIAFVQFSGNKNKKQGSGVVAGSAAVTPVGTGAAGRLTGYMPDIKTDLIWHETNMLGEDTFVSAALDIAGNLLNAAPKDGRKKIVLLLQSNKAGDMDRVDQPLAKLKAADAHVFGIVVRRTSQHAADVDLAAEESLRRLVTEPQDQHLMNVQIDKLEEEVFDRWCNPETAWGQWLVVLHTDSKVPCGFHATSHECDKDSGCAWDDSLVKCTKSPCLQFCKQEDCESADEKLRCEWDGTDSTCAKEQVCAYDAEGTCMADLECWWTERMTTDDTGNPAMMSTCEPVPCKHLTESACLSDDFGCVWDSSLATDRCQIPKCPYVTSGECTADPQCVWDAVAEACGVRQCTHATQTPCDADVKCKWDANTCVELPCVQHLDESSCNTEPSCEWDVSASPAYCKETYCSRWKGEGDCNGDASCGWDATAATCVEFDCELIDKECECMQTPACFWSSQSNGCVAEVFGACPALDIVVAVDGSAGMARSFGRHPSGIVALMSMLRDWIRLLPLSMDTYSKAQAAANSGVRVGIVQFSAPGKFVTTTTTGAHGMLSGDIDELKEDVAYHAAHIAGSLGTQVQRYMEPALDHATYMFKNSPTTTRQRVLLMLTSGTPDDVTALEAARAAMDAGVQTFGVVIRRLSTLSQADIEAESQVKPLASTAKDDHFANLMIDEVPTKVLFALCDASKKFGHAILTRAAEVGLQSQNEHLPCFSYTAARECNSDSGCEWSETMLSCVANACMKYGCDQPPCQADTTCTLKGDTCWKDPAASCGSFTTETGCESAPKDCEWTLIDLGMYRCVDPVCVSHETEDSCVTDAAGCEWKALTEECVRGGCTYPNQGDCEADGACTWKTEHGGYCTPTRCSGATDEANCEQDRACEWRASECVLVECAEHADEATCDHYDGCHWDISEAPPVCLVKRCHRYATEEACETDANLACMWDASGTCVDKDCGKAYTEACPCNSDAYCFWSQAENRCTTGIFGGCPMMDVVVMLDGTSSMGGVFGRHTNGYYGMLELLRDWVKQLPLSGTVASDKAAADGVRVGLVQFGEQAREKKTPQGTGSGGHVSGDLDQVLGDLDYHENNMINTDRAYAAGALTSALAMFNTNTRKKVLLILSDSLIYDATSTDTTYASSLLSSAGVQVYSVLLRPTAAYATGQAEAQASLLTISSNVPEDHYADATMDQLGEILDGLCDPHTQFGEQLATAGGTGAQPVMPCPMYTGKYECNDDKACKWSDRLLTCVDSACVKHCAKPECEEDVTNSCAWDEAGNVCVRDELCNYAEVDPCSKDPGCEWLASEGKCVEQICQHQSEAGCVDDEVGCQWQSAKEKCVVRPCTYKVAAACEANDGCKWDSAITGTYRWAPCVEKPCVTLTKETECGADARCQWTSDRCEVKTGCVTYVDEMSCVHDETCFWDTTQAPAYCNIRPCQKHTTAAACAEQVGECEWQGTTCKELVCGGRTDKCDCLSIPSCAWDSVGSRCVSDLYGACPALDLVVTFDGSGSMSQSFGRHPHGFYAMLEAMRDWVKELPLTGEGASAVAGASSAAASGVRLGFVQFSAANNALKTPAGTGTGGRLSGDATELGADLDWHEVHYQMDQTYVSQVCSLYV
ncbi:hypothetical protein DIPPA_03389 [Diplonema papillatum]|nr:hypothetical protein DIPPA_03389 [Diplonema papillatum]